MNRKILIVGHTFPEPSTTAAGTRMLQLIELFQEQGFDITFASTALIAERSFPLQSISVATEQIQLNSTSFDVFLKKLNPDVVVFDRFITEEQFGWRVAETCPNTISILDTEDLHFLRKAREEAYKNDIPVANANLFSETAKRELASMLRCDLSLIISEVEMKLLTETFKVQESLLFYLPFIVASEISDEIKKEQSIFEARHHFVTVGNLKHAPNVASIKILKQHIWPDLKQKFPKVELHIYGAYAPQQLLEMHNPKERFLVKGWVEDSSEIMKTARVQLAPLPFGAGLKGKLLDALQFGLPTVTTSIGAEGMYGNNNIPGGMTDNWEKFVNVASSLYQDKEQWLQTQQMGYNVLEQRFSKHKFNIPFSDRIAHLLKKIKTHRQEHFIGQILQYHSLQATKYLSKWIEAKGSD